MISSETIEKVKNISLTELISDTVQLKRTGSNFTGLCPFHNEKTPSFHIKEGDNYYHCFGCGASGNVISFAMETQGLSFPDAVEYLAARFKIPVVYEKTNSKKTDISRQDVYKINALAYEFFKIQLRNYASAHKYLSERGFSEDSIKEFGIGFVPDEWEKLYHFLQGRKVPEKLIFAAGLAKKNSAGKMYDTFRGRIIFPVWYDNQRISGFGGRIIVADPEKKLAKYLNSPETLVYRKSKIFYGLPQAIQAIKEKKNVYIVEGYLDVIAMHQAGVKNVIATCGTALTSDHVKRLQGLASQVTLLFDGDSAGRVAAAKCFAQMINFNAEIQVAFLPEGKDPDDIAQEQKEDTAEYLNSLAKVSLLEAFLKEKLASFQVQEFSELGAVQKSQLAKEVMQIISQTQDAIIKGELSKKAAFLMLLDEEDLLALASNKKQTEESVSKEDISDVIPQIEMLDYLNKMILQAAILAKETIPAEIVNDADCCEYLHPTVIQFLDALAGIVADAEADYEAKKKQFLALLQEYPSSWTSFWTRTQSMQNDPLVQADVIFKECKKDIKRRKMQAVIKSLEVEIKSCQNLEAKAKLLQKKLEQERALRTI